MPKSNIKEQLAKKSNVAKFMFRALVVGVVVTGAYGAWKYPNLFNQVKEWLVSKPEVDVYQQQIDALNAQMDALNYKIQGMDKKTGMALSQLKIPDLAPLYEKITMIEKMNMNVINSKADVATVLGVVTRMDKAEHKLDKLSAKDIKTTYVIIQLIENINSFLSYSFFNNFIMETISFFDNQLSIRLGSSSLYTQYL